MRKRSSALLVGLLVALAIFMWGCPKKTPPPPLPPPAEEKPVEKPKVEEPVVKPKPKPTLNLKPIYFDFDKYDIKPEMEAVLTDNAKQLLDNPTVRVRLEGNCDERGTNAYNLALGEKRANAVKDFLVKYGISPDRIETVSYGEERPVCREHNENCWWRNRRVDFVIISQ